jgi:ATP-binding protein involved in chromosome partitioning
VTTPQPVSIIDAKKAISMFRLKTINVPIIGIVENMSWFQSDDSSKKYYIFGRDGGKNLSENLKIPFLGQIPLKESIRESSDVGRPAFLQNSDKIKYFKQITFNVIQKTNERNKSLAPTEKVPITHAKGCNP